MKKTKKDEKKKSKSEQSREKKKEVAHGVLAPRIQRLL